MKMEAVGLSETLVASYKTKRRHIPEDRNLLPVLATARTSHVACCVQCCNFFLFRTLVALIHVH